MPRAKRKKSVVVGARSSKKARVEEEEKKIEVKAARTRLYDLVELGPTMRLRNAEGLVFTPPDKDVSLIGHFEKTVKITKTKMTELVCEQRDFCYIEFVKVSDKSIRRMYCRVVGVQHADVFLEDIEKLQKESDRRCKLENITMLITQKIRYVRKL